TFDRVQQISVASFDSYFGSNWNDIIQPGTSQRLDAVPQVIMNIPQYRNFGTYETIVACHTVDVDNTPRGGIRWYELRKNNGETDWSIRQQGTYAPSDGNSRWMGSIMLNGNNQIALGFSITGSIYPGIRITGQTADEYNAASGAMNITEENIQDGVTYQSSYNRWGDYALMQVDPDDDNTFWFTTQYTGSSGSRKTKITSFGFGTPPQLSSVVHSNVGATSVTLSGEINPSGLSTTYYFEYTNTSTSVTLTTTSQSAGSGSSNVPVSENLTGLTTGVTYTYRLIATNNDGTANSTLNSFTTGMPDLSTTAVSGITSSSATSGGAIVSDGGFSVTSRGVCWSTTQNPTISDSKTSDGSGTGSFSSSITGLSANTTYYVRAYATNSTGTSYGDEDSFTTLCGDFSMPFSENFNASTNLPDCWIIIDNQGGGLVWEFGTHWSGLSGSTGNYANAYGGGLNSMNTDLISPMFDFMDFDNVTLSFSHYFRQLVNSSATLSYSLDNGSTWTQIQQWTSTLSNPTSFSQHISAVDGEQSVRFKWNYTASSGYYWDIDNISITADFTGASWAGTTGTDWFTTGNWSGSELPTPGDNVLIPYTGVSNFPVISGNHAEIDDLTVYSGASVTIAPTGQLTVNGTLKNYTGNSGIVIESDATGTGSLIHSTASISGTVERYVTGGWGSTDAGWHMIGAPVASQAISAFTTEGSGNGYDFYGWDESTNYWMNYKDGAFSAWNGGSVFNPGQGYLISYEQTQDGKAFTGSMNVSGISLSGLTYDVSGWHLISNPFTSALKWNDGNWSLTNVAGIAKVWSESGKSYIDINANGTIPMAQGFMIQVNNAVNSLTIPSASRTHSTQEWYKSGNENPKIRLVAAESDLSSFQESIIQIDPQSTAGFDFLYDSRFLPGYAPQFYAVAGEEMLSTSTFPAISSISELPFGFVKNDASDFYIRLEENFDACKVVLTDLKTGSIQELSQEPRYNFSSEDGDVSTRFILRINPVGVDEMTSGRIHAWVYENRVYIQNPGGTTNLEVTDLTGRRIYKSGLSGEGLLVHDLNLTPGLYLINLRNGEENITIKAFMK
ncbi:MAG: T9SS type A sorting domain-containing protein, partial [Bacteroidetes bacterium]|nr:T9SS type A sorting domain-containing protein [Bacteroidota bacterium]